MGKMGREQRVNGLGQCDMVRYSALVTRKWFCFLWLVWLAACSRPEQPSPTLLPPNLPPVPAGASPTAFVLPTLYPTFTPLPPATPLPSRTPVASPTPATAIDFEQKSVLFRYVIPALGLDRRLEGTVGGQITVVDETTGIAAIRTNSGTPLQEMQTAFPGLNLEPLPENCDSCVYFEYELPLSGQADSGWLTEAYMLASIENFTAINLGAHFPAGTILGLRRSATAYEPAHSLALTDNGQLYRWLATEPQVTTPITNTTLAGLLPAVPLATLAENYLVSCPAAPVETLYLNPAGTPTTIRLTCPAFSLPTSLLPLYLQLDSLLQESLAAQSLSKPPFAIPLATLLHYQRADGSCLTLTQTEQAIVTAPAGTPITATLSLSQIISYTTPLLDSGTLQPGLQLFGEATLPNLLLVRGDQGLNEIGWSEIAPPAVQTLITRLDTLLNELLASDN